MLEPAAASACVVPGIVVQTDASGDEFGDPTTSQLDLTSVSIAEPYTAADDQSITFTVNVNNLTGGPQTNSTLVSIPVNGEPGVLALRNGRPFALMVLRTREGLVEHISSLADPRQLAYLSPLA